VERADGLSCGVPPCPGRLFRAVITDISVSRPDEPKSRKTLTIITDLDRTYGIPKDCAHRNITGCPSAEVPQSWRSQGGKSVSQERNPGGHRIVVAHKCRLRSDRDRNRTRCRRNWDRGSCNIGTGIGVLKKQVPDRPPGRQMPEMPKDDVVKRAVLHGPTPHF